MSPSERRRFGHLAVVTPDTSPDLPFAHIRKRQEALARSETLPGVLALALLLLALLFGGGTRNFLLSDLSVQLFAAILLVYGWRRLRWDTLDLPLRQLMLIFAAILLLPLLQLLPLPTFVVMWFPGRDELWSERAALGLSVPMWSPWTLDPNATLAALRGLLPAAALAVLGCQLNADWLRRMATLVIVIALIMVPIGIAQVAQGPHSELRPFTPTNIHDAVGLFANRNHYAALLVSALTFVFAGLILDSRRATSRHAQALAMFGWIMAGCLLLLGLVLSRSRAGIGLAALLTLAMLLIAFSRRRKHPQVFRWLLGFSVLGGALAFQFGFLAFADRLGQASDLRWNIIGDVLALAGHFGWLGSGLGSFPAAYDAHESIALVGSKIVGHAHNDWAELWVELGIVLLPLTLVFAYWYWQRLRQLFSASGLSSYSLQLGGCMAVAVLSLHSLVDYPLRTTAMSVVFVLACLMCCQSPSERASSAA